MPTGSVGSYHTQHSTQILDYLHGITKCQFIFVAYTDKFICT
uniref:Uncharacterized protein n=1 Tax=Anguilla anguilla TaxID=7936 RepID=A0A0E9SKZ5_ANGAN